MEVTCYGPRLDNDIVRIASVVRDAQAGDEIRVLTDMESMISDMRAFAHMSGNEVSDIERRETITLDLHQEDGNIFAATFGRPYLKANFWVIILRVLPGNKLASHSAANL